MIDTDERVTPELRQAILKVLDAPSAAPSTASPAVTIFSDALCATAVGIPIASCACTNAPVTAITIIWSMNRWIASGAEVIPLTGDLLHLTCRDFAGFQQKQLAYAAAWALERHQKGKKTSMAGIFSHTLGAFLKTLLLRGGVLDGKQGWLLAMVNAQYTFTKYTELWALSHGYSEKESS